MHNSNTSCVTLSKTVLHSCSAHSQNLSIHPIWSFAFSISTFSIRYVTCSSTRMSVICHSLNHTSRPHFFLILTCKIILFCPHVSIHKFMNNLSFSLQLLAIYSYTSFFSSLRINTSHDFSLINASNFTYHFALSA